MPESPPTIPQFELLRRIGQGSYGEVWLARSITGAYRAVKVVFRARFEDDRPYEREFHGIQKFEPVSVGEPTQVSVLHVGRDDKAGFFYYVMELADDIETGDEINPDQYVPKTLKEVRARRERLRADECLAIGLDLTRALAHLHAHGLVHRDIKPSNVIFVHDVPKLADLGLVSAADTSRSFVGTEGFVPPEGPGGASADLYGLGKVLYEISNGRDRNDFPKLPENFELHPDKAMLLELNEVVLKACDADPRRRYASAEVMRENLALLQAGRSVRRLHQMERRFRLVAKYGVGVSVLTALAFGAFLWTSGQARLARESFEKAEEQRVRAEHAETDALKKLHEARVNWVRANRLTGRLGQRFAGLSEIAKAAANTNSLDLRNEAIACLAVPDLRPIKRWWKTPEWDSWGFSASFRRYATNDAAGNLTVHDTETDKILFVLPTSGAPLVAAMTSRDDHWLATSDSLETARIWNLDERKAQPISFPKGARLLTFTPDSQALVVEHHDGSLHFLDPASAAEIKSLTLSRAYAEIYFNNSGDKFFALVDGDLSIHETKSGKFLRTIRVPNGSGSVAWHPDGRRVAVGWRMKIGLWDIEDGAWEATFEGHESQVTGIVFNDTGEWMITASWDGTLRVWQTETRRELLRTRQAGNGLRLSSDCRRLAFKSWNHSTVEMWELGDEGVMRRYSCPKPPPFTGQIRFSPDGRLVVVVNENGVGLYGSHSGRLLATVPTPAAMTAEFLPSGKELLVDADSALRLWPIQSSPGSAELTIGPPRTLHPALGETHQFTLSADGRRVALIRNPTVSTFNLTSPEDRVTSDPAIQAIGWPCLSADGSWGASISADREKVQIWNGRTGQSITNLPVPNVLAILLSPDNRWLLCSSTEESMFWETSTWQLRHRSRGEPNAEDMLIGAFDPSSSLSAVVASAQGVRLSRLDNWEELATLPSGRAARQLTFSPDGSRLAIVYEPGYFQIWDLRRVRSELALLNLGWPQPSYPANRSSGIPLTHAVVLTAAPEVQVTEASPTLAPTRVTNRK